MTDLRTAAQQALEAWDNGDIECFKRSYTVMENLRAALAQQAEPVDTDCHTQGICQRSGYGITQQAEPVEPVAGVVLNEEGRAALVEHGREEWHCAVRNARPLYPAPPKRKPLTDEEILEAVGWERAEMYMKLTPNFPVEEARKETIKNARAIERKVRGEEK